MKPVGLYFHIPFCIKKCLYCDFNSYSGIEHIMEDYIDAVVLEVKTLSGKFADEYYVDTIYIGGGTPTLLHVSMLEHIIDISYRSFRVKDMCEISIEANPGTVDEKKLEQIFKMGVNRISFGLQSWNNEELKFLGRIHTVSDFLQSYNLAKKQGFDNINIDIMYAIPGQTLNSWEQTLNNVIDLNPEHISCYGLKIEAGTPFHHMQNEGHIKDFDEEIDRYMYHMALDKLSCNNYNHYEISNFAKSGYECRHNVSCWKAGEYIGIGCGAHSHIRGKRYSNVAKPLEYIVRLRKGEDIIADTIVLSEKVKISEYIFLGFRLREGINVIEFYNRFNFDFDNLYKRQIDKFKNVGLIEKCGDNYKLTLKGIDISNAVLSEFLL